MKYSRFGARKNTHDTTASGFGGGEKSAGEHTNGTTKATEEQIEQIRSDKMYNTGFENLVKPDGSPRARVCVAHVASVCVRRFCFPLWQAIARTHTRPEKRRNKNAYAHQCTRQKAYFSCTAVWPPMGQQTRANPKERYVSSTSYRSAAQKPSYFLGSQFLVVRLLLVSSNLFWLAAVVFSPLAQ